jgi:hypothetical protein
MDETPPPATAEHLASLERATSVGSNRRHLAIVLGVALVTLGVDVVAAWLSGSLALMESERTPESRNGEGTPAVPDSSREPQRTRR